MIVLVADDLGPIPETIRSRCQLVPFTRLSERAIREVIDARAPELDEDAARRRSRGSPAAGSTGSRGCSTRAPPRRRDALLEQARAVYREPGFEPADAAAALLECCRGERGAEAQGARGGEGAGPRAARARGRAARAPRAARRRARGAAGAARGARGLVPRPRRRRASAPRRRRSTSTGSTSCARTRPASACSAPSAPPRPCARRGASSRSSTSRRSSRSRRSSSSSHASCSACLTELARRLPVPKLAA